MTESNRVATAVDDDDEKLIEVRLGTPMKALKVAPDDIDVFAKSIDEIRGLSGLSATTKRQATRQMQKFQRGINGAHDKKEELPYANTAYSLFEVVQPPYNMEYLAALFEKNEAHAAAIKAKVRNIAALGYDFVESETTLEVMDRASGDENKLNRIRRKLSQGRRELEDWLDSTNEEDEFVETLIKVWTDYETTGNGYLEIGRGTNGQIGYIGHVPSTSMRIRKKRDGFVQIISKSAVFFRNFGDKETPNPLGDDDNPNEVLHFKKYSPTNGYYGIPDIISALNAVVGNEYSARFNIDYFENKAVPRYVIIIKGGNLSPRSEQQILEFFQSSIKGTNHRTLYVPLPADEEGRKVSFEMKPVEVGVQDASFPNYRRANLNAILMAHGVPITKVSSGEGIALAAARDLDKTFKEQVCRPEQSILEKKLNKVIKEISDVFVIKLQELSLTDEDTQSKIDERYLRLGTVLPNEVRSRKGMTGIPGGDKPAVVSPQVKNEMATQASGNRQRDQQRQANSTDSASSTNSRNEQGAGRQQG